MGSNIFPRRRHNYRLIIIDAWCNLHTTPVACFWIALWPAPKSKHRLWTQLPLPTLCTELHCLPSPQPFHVDKQSYYNALATRVGETLRCTNRHVLWYWIQGSVQFFSLAHAAKLVATSTDPSSVMTLHPGSLEAGRRDFYGVGNSKRHAGARARRRLNGHMRMNKGARDCPSKFLGWHVHCHGPKSDRVLEQGRYVGRRHEKVHERPRSTFQPCNE